MACNCYDELAALYVKFETIEDLCEQILAKLISKATGAPGVRKRQYEYWELAEHKEKPKEINDNFWEIVKMVIESGILN